MNKYMGSKQEPYEFYFIDELAFEELCNSLTLEKTEKNISTVGFITEFDLNYNIAILKLNTPSIINTNMNQISIRLNLSRVANSFRWNKNLYYFVYGALKVK
jgi:hypothetical protein